MEDNIVCLDSLEFLLHTTDSESEPNNFENLELNDVPPNEDSFNACIAETQAKLTMSKHSGQHGVVPMGLGMYSGTRVNGQPS